jgi:hypothetical protein
MATNSNLSGASASKAKYMLTPKLIEMFNNLSNPQAGQRMTDPRESSYNGVSGFDLYNAWKNNEYTVGSENDALKYTMAAPVTKPEVSSPVADVFSKATGGSLIDYVDNPITPKTATAFIKKQEQIASISLVTAETQQPAQPTPLDSALSISKETGVTYDSPLLTYSDRAKLFKQRMNYG